MKEDNRMHKGLEGGISKLMVGGDLLNAKELGERDAKLMNGDGPFTWACGYHRIKG